MTDHFDKSFTTRDPEMARYLAAIRGVAKHFLGITVQTIPRGNNEAADELAKLASSAQHPPPNIFYEVLRAPLATLEAQGTAAEAQGAVRGSNPVLLINEADWRDAIAKYLKGEELEDPVEAKRLQHRTRNYCIVDGLMYKGGVCAPPLLRCVSRGEGQSLL